MMRRQRLWLIMCLCGLAGCTLRDPLEVSVSCPDAEYYMNANGEILGHFDDPSDPFYSVYLETQFCPMAFPECYPKKDVALCHESCRENEIFCTDHCIKPLEDKTYCGAKGLCNDGDVDSDDYRGKTCRKDQKCEEGQCVCARDTDIMCGDQCIDANNNDDFCGAKGSCNSSDVNSDDFKGHKCDKNQRCSDGQCVCARDSDILCDGKCTDPNNDMTYCGAKGLCTDSEMTSDNYKGITCDKSQRCSEGQCVCAREDDIECGGKCIDPENSDDYCGAKRNGLCTDAEITSKDYRGQKCDITQRCVKGVCVCARSSDVLCDGLCIDPDFEATHCGAKRGGLCNDSAVGSDNYKGAVCVSGQICENGKCKCAMNGYVLCGEKCINPASENEHCGAQGLCTDTEPESPDFAGGNCASVSGPNGNDNRCELKKCICGEGYHVYKNSCEPDSNDNCGSHGNACRVSDFLHSTNVECKKNDLGERECMATACETDYFSSVDGKTCMGCTDLVGSIKSAIAEETEHIERPVIQFGRYRHLSDSEELQPINWRVLEVDDEKGILLISEYVLDVEKYYTVEQGVTWANSTIRSWLNGLDGRNNNQNKDYSAKGNNFISVAFNDEEMKCISTVENINPDYVSGSTTIPGGVNTNDKIFLLSRDEAKSYFENNTERKAYATTYARNKTGYSLTIDSNDYIDVYYQGANVHQVVAYWWLRSPIYNIHNVAYVDLVGSVYIFGCSVAILSVGVRPALWLKRDNGE